jgi:hypothetical protein
VTEKREWVEPTVVTVDIPVVEGALAESYRAAATRWADEAEARRKSVHAAAAATED